MTAATLVAPRGRRLAGTSSAHKPLNSPHMTTDQGSAVQL